MKSLSQKLTLASAALAATGILALAPTESVSAETQWEARTVEEVRSDLEKSESGEKTYTVQFGDTLAVIAQALEVDLGVLASVNNIANVDQIVAGTEITVSADQSTVTTTQPSGETTTSQTSQESTGQTQASASATTSSSSNSSSSSSSSYQAPAQSSSSSNYTSSASGSEAAAKEWIAQRESGGSYSAYNPAGGYYGRYQLNPSLINYGASPAEQEAAADRYVANRYGSWSNAKNAWQSQGWY